MLFEVMRDLIPGRRYYRKRFAWLPVLVDDGRGLSIRWWTNYWEVYQVTPDARVVVVERLSMMPRRVR